jgi:hypothetical protein
MCGRRVNDILDPARTDFSAGRWRKDYNMRSGYRVCVRTNKTQTFVREPGRTADPSAASLRSEAVTFLISCGRKAAKSICQ